MPFHPSRHPHRALFTPQPAPRIYKLIAISFLGVTIVVFVAALWLFSARARILIKAKREFTSVDTFIDLTKNPEAGQLRARVVKGTFSKIQEFSVKGGASTEGLVTGTVKLINNYSKAQTLVATTRLLTSDNRLYHIYKTVVIQPKQFLTVTAHADKAGSSFALPLGTKLTIPGLWKDVQKWIYAETMKGFTPSTSVAKVATDADIKEAFATLETAVSAQAESALRVEAKVSEDWKGILQKKIVERKTTVTSGQKTETLLASLTLEVTGVFYPAKEVEILLRQRLKEKLPDERELTEFDPARANILLDAVDMKLEKARLHLTAQALSRLTDKSPQMAKSNFLGLSESDTVTKLKSIDGVEGVEIRIRPTWIHRIPTNAEHVELIVQ